METLKRYMTSKEDALGKASIANCSQLQEPTLLSYRYHPMKQRPRSLTLSALIDSDGSSSVPYTIIQNDKAEPLVEFSIKQLDSALHTAFVLLSSCDKTLGHLPNKLKQSMVQKAQEDSKVMSNHVNDHSVAESGNAQSRNSIGSADSIIHRFYSRTHTTTPTSSASHVTNYTAHSLSTWDLQQAVKKGATQVQTLDKRYSSDMTDSSESCSTVTSEPSSPTTPNHIISFPITNEDLFVTSPMFQPMEPVTKDMMDLPFTKSHTITTTSSQQRSTARSSQGESCVFSKRATGLGLANQVHSVLGDAIKQADIELHWDEYGEWESDEESEPTMTEEEMRDYEFERNMAMRRNPIQRHMSENGQHLLLQL